MSKPHASTMATSTGAVPRKVKGVINSSAPLPIAKGELTAAWFTNILDKPVKEIVEFTHGTASKILAELTFENRADAPARVCVKGGFDPALLANLPFIFAPY